ncbi:MAG: hypothetical protein Q9174_004806 [Haloplaca sp. 1 TL-2023]
MAAKPISNASRIRGSLYGVAICDALGGPVEFCFRGTFDRVTDFRHNDNFNLPPGCWTDDTSMTLCLAQSLVDGKGLFDAKDQVQKYMAWYETGYMSSIGRCFDIGNATRTALSTWRKQLENDAGAESMQVGQNAIDRTLKRKVQCGNGSLMRVSPIGLVFHSNIEMALEYAAASSQLTHPYPTNAEACKIYTQLIASTFSRVSKADLASLVTRWPYEDPDLKLRLGRYGNLEAWQEVGDEQISSSGYVVHSLEASLWAFFTTDGFETGALKAVNLGEDADTVGAIYGGLAGAFYGVETLPQTWTRGLQAKGKIDDVVEGVVKLASNGG